MILASILITGHDGFIGSHLTKALSQKYKILGLSNNVIGKQTNVIKKDIRKLLPSDVKQKLYAIIHLAAVSDIEFCEKNQIKCFQINVEGTQNILKLAREKKCKLIFVSSSHVYGIPKKNPVSENDSTSPITTYGFSKLAAEILCEKYAREYGLDICTLRLFSVYGKKKNPTDVVSQIITQSKSKKIIQLGNLYPKRDFIYVTDVINAIILVLKSKGFKIFNVGTGKSHSILEMAYMIQKITNRNFKIESIQKKSRKKEVKNIAANCNKLKQLGWMPHVSLVEGLKNMVE